MADEPVPADGPGAADRGAPPDPAPPGGHDPAGLDLARAAARALRAAIGGAAGRPAGASPRRGRRHPRRGAVDPVVSGAHPDERDPQPLARGIDRLVADRGWSTDVAVHGIFGRWDRIVGAEVAEHTRPERYADGELVVRAESTAWATQLRLLAPVVVRRLNQDLGDGTVRRVHVLGPDAPSWRRGRWSVRGGRGPRDTYG
jgi:predicted nucleic acid-binding Zn ribbon protein